MWYRIQFTPRITFSRQQQSELPFPFPGDLPNPGIKPRSPALQADSLPPQPSGKPLIVFSSHQGPHMPYDPPIEKMDQCAGINGKQLSSFKKLPCYILE